MLETNDLKIMNIQQNPSGMADILAHLSQHAQMSLPLWACTAVTNEHHRQPVAGKPLVKGHRRKVTRRNSLDRQCCTVVIWRPLRCLT